MPFVVLYAMLCPAFALPMFLAPPCAFNHVLLSISLIQLDAQIREMTALLTKVQAQEKMMAGHAAMITKQVACPHAHLPLLPQACAPEAHCISLYCVLCFAGQCSLPLLMGFAPLRLPFLPFPPTVPCVATAVYGRPIL